MKFRYILLSAGLLTTALLQSASAQVYRFSEVPSGLSLFASPVIFSVTDTGEYLIVLGVQTGPGSAFIFSDDKLTSVPANVGDSFYAMNTPGYLVGTGNNGAFLQNKSGKQTILTPPTGDSIYANNLNNLDVLVGGATNAQGTSLGFSWKSGTISTYTYPGSTGTISNGISDVGDMVGSYFLAGTENTTYAFHLTKAGKVTEITVPNNPSVYASMINNSGLIVGYASATGTTTGQIGWYMTKAGKLTTFDVGDSAPVAMPGPKGPLTLVKSLGVNNVWAVNNLGWIGGSYFGQYEDAIGGYVISLPFVGQ